MAMATLLGLVGCEPTSGVITGTSGPTVGSSAPDVQYISVEGTQGDFNKARYPVAIIAFAAPEAASCCWIDPKLVNIADQLLDLPVTVAQFSLPKGKCLHGRGCIEACNLRNGGLMSLCDAQWLAWDAYGRPAPGSLILIGPDNRILLTGSLKVPNAIIAEAKRLGQADKNRLEEDGRKKIYLSSRMEDDGPGMHRR